MKIKITMIVLLSALAIGQNSFAAVVGDGGRWQGTNGRAERRNCAENEIKRTFNTHKIFKHYSIEGIDFEDGGGDRYYIVFDAKSPKGKTCRGHVSMFVSNVRGYFNPKTRKGSSGLATYCCVNTEKLLDWKVFDFRCEGDKLVVDPVR